MTEQPSNGMSDLPLAVPTPEVEWAAIRNRRDQLLRATDFTQLPDYPVTTEQLAQVKTYRKALRDIPEMVVHPSELVWPDLPSFVK
ncbi:phage tail assembly chaperone [Pseudomonas sp. TNT2022 ID233]|uniref:tail fiber assembly protein n=1 Tax=Pseudomonas aphyarum TaxID=2942629 RepID=UPI002360535B|nr:tail fiber assembly protein [Pseudomonas aphyarum]MDD1138771.1 phage tail assembly chaperone [Pseudomonas aphyarum]